jgi:hypothetical protein
MILALDAQEWRHRPTFAIYAIDRRCPFPITRLHLFALSTPFGARYNHYRYNNTYYKTRFVEIIQIYVLDTVGRAYISYKPKPRVNGIGILVEGSLEVVYARKTRPEFFSSLYETAYLELPDVTRAT